MKRYIINKKGESALKQTEGYEEAKVAADIHNKLMALSRGTEKYQEYNANCIILAEGAGLAELDINMMGVDKLILAILEPIATMGPMSGFMNNCGVSVDFQ